jgi:hypothetical protein
VLDQGAHGAKGDQVAGGEHRVERHAPGDEFGHGRVPAQLRAFGVHLQALVDLQPRLLQGPGIAAVALEKFGIVA